MIHPSFMNTQQATYLKNCPLNSWLFSFVFPADTRLPCIHVDLHLLPLHCIYIIMETCSSGPSLLLFVHCPCSHVREAHDGPLYEDDEIIWCCRRDRRTGDLFDQDCLHFCGRVSDA